MPGPDPGGCLDPISAVECDFIQEWICCFLLGSRALSPDPLSLPLLLEEIESLCHAESLVWEDSPSLARDIWVVMGVSSPSEGMMLEGRLPYLDQPTVVFGSLGEGNSSFCDYACPPLVSLAHLSLSAHPRL